MKPHTPTLLLKNQLPFLLSCWEHVVLQVRRVSLPHPTGICLSPATAYTAFLSKLFSGSRSHHGRKKQSSGKATRHCSLGHCCPLLGQEMAINPRRKMLSATKSACNTALNFLLLTNLPAFQEKESKMTGERNSFSYFHSLYLVINQEKSTDCFQHP